MARAKFQPGPINIGSVRNFTLPFGDTEDNHGKYFVIIADNPVKIRNASFSNTISF
jgi:hypothetical protein